MIISAQLLDFFRKMYKIVKKNPNCFDFIYVEHVCRDCIGYPLRNRGSAGSLKIGQGVVLAVDQASG